MSEKSLALLFFCKVTLIFRFFSLFLSIWLHGQFFLYFVEQALSELLLNHESQTIFHSLHEIGVELSQIVFTLNMENSTDQYMAFRYQSHNFTLALVFFNFSFVFLRFLSKLHFLNNVLHCHFSCGFVDLNFELVVAGERVAVFAKFLVCILFFVVMNEVVNVVFVGAAR